MNKFFYLILSLCLLCAGFVSAQQNKGELSNLVCFVRFADEDEAAFEKTADRYESLFNSADASAVSVYNYFQQASYNQLRWKSAFFPSPAAGKLISFQASHTRSYYLHYSSINTDGYNVDNSADALLREQNLVKEITDYLNTVIPDGATIDANNDGIVDNICIILSGNSEISAKYMMWPHRSTLYLKKGTIAGKTVNEYIMLFEGGNGWNSFNPIEINAGVLCHEMSHTLGTRDLYHTQKGLNPVGIWDLMSDNQLTPQGMSVYTKYKYCKWIDEIPEMLTPGTYTLHPVGGSSKENIAYKLKLPGSDEFFVFEYRKKVPPFESGLPGSGLLIYRINPNFTGNEGYNGTSKFDEQYLFRPGGTVTADGNIAEAFFSQESGRTAFGGSASMKPFYYDGTEANFAITNVGTCGETISFELLPATAQLILSQKELAFSGESGSNTKIQLKAVNTAWKVSSCPDWLSLSATTGVSGSTDLVLTTKGRNEQFATRNSNVVFQSTEDANVQVELKVSQLSAIIQAPYGLTGSVSGSNVSLSWKKPLEGSPVMSEDFENTANKNLWTIQSENNVGWLWQESVKYKLSYSGAYSARLNSETIDRHQNEWLISPKFANGGRLFFYSNSIAVKKNNAHNFYYVEVSTDDGVTWNRVFDLKTQGTVVNAYEQLEVDLSQYQSQNMRIAFHAYDDNNVGLSYWWHVDNIQIYPELKTSVVKEYQIYRNGQKIGVSANCSFTDNDAPSGTNVYTVKAVGDFGETLFSNQYSAEISVTGVKKYNIDEDIRWITNRDVLSVSSAAILKGVALYDLRGSLLFQDLRESKDYNVPVTGLPAGIFFLKTFNSADQFKTFKIIR